MATPAVEFVPVAGPGLIAGLAIDPGLANFRPPEKQQEVLVHLAGRPGRMISIAVHGQNIVGYIALHRVNPDFPALHELQGIEVSPSFRKSGVAAGLLTNTFALPVLDDFVVYVTGDPYFWDLEGTGLTVWRYRGVLARLYGSVGFSAKSAIRPGIIANVANLLMVRAGKNVPEGWEAWCYPLLGITTPADPFMGGAQGESGSGEDSAMRKDPGINSDEFIPDRERWLLEDQVRKDLDQAIAWAGKNPPAPSDLADLEKKIFSGK